MAFQSRNLRVQLPCGSVTVIQCTLGHTLHCYFPTYCHFPTYQNCHTYITCIFGTCTLPSPIACQFGTDTVTVRITELTPNCGTTRVAQGPIQVGREELGLLREALQAQLEEVEGAERALSEAEKEQAD
jgi:hypothetical protein